MWNFFSETVGFWTNKINLCIEENGSYTHNLKENLEALEKATEDLTAKRDTLSRKVGQVEDRGLQVQGDAEIKVWLTRVETIETKVKDLLCRKDDELKRLCLCGLLSNNCISSHRYGKTVFSTLRDVEELKKKEFDVIADQPQTSQKIQLQPIIVGQKEMLETALNHLKKDEVGIMAMYGMGGVGKTTLLEQIHNEMSGFDFVIWVVVSKELQVEKLQDEIARKVGVGGGDWNEIDKVQKSNRLYNCLMKRRFVLFLDDIWEKVELKEIGIPDPTTQNRCKVVFTTRSLDVCASMMVEDPMEVQCLPENDALDLFEKRVTKTTLGSDPGIPDLARIVAKKCGGLPLALNVIGQTMSGKRMIQEWHHAINVLNSYAIKFSGMDKILPLLKYSYDNLEGEHLKSCLLYCALFPEDAKIPIEDLIEYWICEEIIDASEGIEMAEEEGLPRSLFKAKENCL